MEDDEDHRRRQQNGEKKGVIKIPSYQEVFEGSSVSPLPYNPPFAAKSLPQAFSFLRNSEFYNPPPPPPADSPNPSGGGSRVSHLESAQDRASSSSSTPCSSSPQQNRNAILVSHRQKGNPLLKHIRNAKWVYADIVPDYMLGQASCALYISLRYHLLHPDYLYYRIRELQKNFKLRVVLCHVDVEDVAKPLLEVTRTAMLHECTLLCAWSLEECGRYLETIKVYENKPADSIREQTDTDYLSRMTRALTAVRHVNRTDVVTLGSTFGSLSHIMDASMEDLAKCPGVGERKVKRLYDTFHEPFRKVLRRPEAPPAEPIGGKDAAAAESPPPPGIGCEGQDGGEASATAASESREPDLNVKSALTAAFAKYANKIRKRQRGGDSEPSSSCQPPGESSK